MTRLQSIGVVTCDGLRHRQVRFAGECGGLFLLRGISVDPRQPFADAGLLKEGQLEMIKITRSVCLAAALSASAVAMAAKVNVLLTGIAIPSITAAGTPTNSPSGTANFKCTVNSDTGAFVAKADKGTSTSQFLGPKNKGEKAEIDIPFNQSFNIPNFGTVSATGTAFLDYAKPKVKKGKITDANVKVTGEVVGTVSI